MVAETSTSEGPQAATFLNFSFFRVDPKWRWLNEIGKEEAAKEFSSLVEVAKTKIKVRTYSTLGLREDSDLMLWMISNSLEKTQVMTSKIYSTVLGKYLLPSHVFLSATRPSVYSSKITPGFMTDEQPMKYCIVYPFVKSREWYLLAFETMDLMEFQELIIQLRETKVSKYIIRDTPMIVCVYKGVEGIIKDLG